MSENNTQRKGLLYKLLETASIYGFVQSVLGAGNVFKVLANEYILTKEREVDSILDLGCGPAEILHSIKNQKLRYYGCDINADYLSQAKKRFGERGVFFSHDFIQDGASLHEKVPLCDVVIATGILHHLDDNAAMSLIKTGYSNLKNDGRLISLENVITTDQNPIAKWVIKHDRGRFVRTQVELLALFHRCGFKTNSILRTDMLRIPYTHLITIATKESVLHDPECVRVISVI
jgi:SAM-dependent methyltransferase